MRHMPHSARYRRKQAARCQRRRCRYGAMSRQIFSLRKAERANTLFASASRAAMPLYAARRPFYWR